MLLHFNVIIHAAAHQFRHRGHGSQPAGSFLHARHDNLVLPLGQAQ